MIAIENHLSRSFLVFILVYYSHSHASEVQSFFVLGNREQ
jgi:hypothetical protein